MRTKHALKEHRCNVCDEAVSPAMFRDHLEEHHPLAHTFSWDEVSEQYRLVDIMETGK